MKDNVCMDKDVTSSIRKLMSKIIWLKTMFCFKASERQIEMSLNCYDYYKSNEILDYYSIYHYEQYPFSPY